MIVVRRALGRYDASQHEYAIDDVFSRVDTPKLTTIVLQQLSCFCQILMLSIFLLVLNLKEETDYEADPHPNKSLNLEYAQPKTQWNGTNNEGLEDELPLESGGFIWVTC